jgi:hypothetical protein
MIIAQTVLTCHEKVTIALVAYSNCLDRIKYLHWTISNTCVNVWG